MQACFVKHTWEEEDQETPEDLSLDRSRGVEELEEDVDVDKEDEETEDTTTGTVSDNIAVALRFDWRSSNGHDERCEDEERVHDVAWIDIGQ